MMKMEELTLTQDWDKTFPKSGKVDHCKVTFVNRYGITLAADMYSPKDAEGKLPAIAAMSVTWLLPTSTPKTLWQRSISCPFVTRSIRSA